MVVGGKFGQGAWTAERHVMAAGTYGPSGQLIFDKIVVHSCCTCEAVTAQK